MKAQQLFMGYRLPTAPQDCGHGIWGSRSYNRAIPMLYSGLLNLRSELSPRTGALQVRNAGNLVPHSQSFVDEVTTTEPAALELGCIVNNIRHVIVCGHSDCKAMNLLHSLRCEEFSSQNNLRLSPLRGWLMNHGHMSLAKYQQLELEGFCAPLVFQAETPMRKFVAYIDPENRFSIEDKLSQVNCLQQLQNIASYGFLKRKLETHQVHIHALWFDIYTGDIFYFSRQNKRFVEINEDTVEKLLREVNRYYS